MTVALGVACQDGAVIATDSMGMNGKVASSITKVHHLDLFPLVFTYAGSSYVFQEVLEATPAIEAGWVVEGLDWDQVSDIDVKKLVERDFTPIIRDAYARIVTPPNGHLQDHSVDLMFASWTVSSGGFLIRLYADNAITLHREPMAAIGYGHEYAVVAQGLLSHHINNTLSLQEAELLAHRTISAVCDVSSGGVRPPIQVARVDASGLHVHTADQVDALALAVDRWKVIEREAFLQLLDPQSAPVGAKQDLPSAE